MAAQAGTLEQLALSVARALHPLAFRLSDGTVIDTFTRLGVEFPPELISHPAISGPRASAAKAAADLSSLIDDLRKAIDVEDTVGVQAASAALVAQLAVGFTALDALQTSLRDHGAELPGITQAQVDTFVADLVRKLLDLVLVDAVDEHLPMLSAVLTFAGIIERTPVDGDPADPTQPEYEAVAIRLDVIPQIVADPAGHLSNLYDWGDPAFDGADLLAALHAALGLVGFPSQLLPATATEPVRLDSLAFQVRAAPPGIEAIVTVPLSVDETVPLTIADSIWSGEVTMNFTLDASLTAQIRPPLNITVATPPPTFTGDGDVRLIAAATEPVVLFGAPGATRLEARRAEIGAGLVFTDAQPAHASVSARIVEGRLVIGLGGADSFLGSVLPKSLESRFDIAASWAPNTGLELEGAAELRLVLPLAIDIGPARLEQLALALGIDGDGVVLELGLDAGVSLGPIAVSVEGVGAAVELGLRPGNLGPLDLSLRFVPPAGLGLAIDAGPVEGGGFIRLDPPRGRYAGIFEVTVGPVGVTAIGLLDTRLPGGGTGYSLLVVLRGSFPPVQLGFGFALSSVGGLLGLNRVVDVDALRSRMASGTVGRILAPEDPIRNAPLLLADLGAVFPPAAGVVVVGPTLQMSWAELVRFDIGVFIELPGPRKIVVLGSARAGIDNPSGGKPYLQIRLDILGVVDFTRQLVAVDAVLIDSHLLEILELTGGAAFRLSYGAQPYVVLTVGGFHPAYDPSPLVFPSSLTRIAMVRGTPTDFLYFRFEGYFAITTNTLQFGAAVEVIINLGPFNIRGFLGFDALIRFQPFSFRFTIAASVKVRWRSHNLGGLDLRGELSGPGPVVFRGKVCFEILWWEICFEETFSLGSSTPPAVTPVPSAVAELAAELDRPANLRAVGGVDPRVALSPASDAALPIISPLGQAVWTQQLAPLELLLQRFGGAPLTRPETVRATGLLVTGSELDWFAPGSFAELSDADALNRKAFERLQGGVRIGMSGVDEGPAGTLPVKVRQIRLPAAVQSEPNALALPPWLLRAVAARYGTVERDPVTPAMAVREEGWVLRDGVGAVAAAGLSQAQAHQLSSVAAAGTALAAADTVPAMSF